MIYRHPPQERRPFTPPTVNQRGPVDQPHRRPERDHRRRDREPQVLFSALGHERARVPEAGGKD